MHKYNERGDQYMLKTIVVKSWKYSETSKHLKIFYTDGTADLFNPVPEFIFNSLSRALDKRTFIEKHLEYNLQFTRISIQ